MSLLLLGLALLLLVAPGRGRALSRRVAPHVWVRSVAASIGGGLLALEAGLVLMALPTVLRSLHITAFADVCQRLAGHLVPGGPVTAWGSAVAAVALPLAAARGSTTGARAHRDLRARVGLGRVIGTCDSHPIVEIPTSERLAVAVPGRPGCVILTTGVLEALSHDEQDAVVRHEVAHLKRRHWRSLALAAGVRGALGWLPPVRSSVQLLRFGLERVADEDAAGRDIDRRKCVGRAIVTLMDSPVTTSGLAFSNVELTAGRLQALRNPPPDSATVGFITRASVAAMLIAAGATLGIWIGHTHRLVALAGFCQF